jgi:hypothetical protein
MQLNLLLSDEGDDGLGQHHCPMPWVIHTVIHYLSVGGVVVREEDGV